MYSSSLKYGPPDVPTLNPTSLFFGSRAKLYWARRHVHQLSISWETMIEEHVDAVVRKKTDSPYGPKNNPTHVKIPLELPMYIGDSIRNFRSALDYLPSSMARAVNLSDGQTIFPFNSERSGIEASFNPPKAGEGHRRGRRAGALYELSRHYPELEDIILNTIQPYSAGDGAGKMGDLIWRVITSDNIDKHRLMTPAISKSGVKNFVMGGVGVQNLNIIGDVFRFKAGDEIQGNPEIAFDITFAEPAKLAGKPVVSTLVETSDHIEAVIALFESKFDAIN